MDQLLAMRTFVRIVEAGSLAKAAGSLNLPRSSVSKQLQDLEAHLGTPLIARSTRAATVTDEGAAYYARALRLLSDLEEMDTAAKGGAARPAGRLRVDIGSSLANLILIPALPDFLERYPEIELVLGVADRDVDLIGEGVDCVIRGGALSDSTLIARRLAELDYVTCAAPGYLARHGTPDGVEAVARDHAALAYFSASTGNAVPLRFGRGTDRSEVAPRRQLSVNESTAHMTALLAGIGLGQTFEFVARPYLRDGRLVEVLHDHRPAPMPLHLIYPSSRHAGARLRLFIDWAAALFRTAVPAA